MESAFSPLPYVWVLQLSAPVEHVRDHLDFGLCSRDLLCRGHLRGATEEERHCDGNMVFLLIE